MGKILDPHEPSTPTPALDQLAAVMSKALSVSLSKWLGRELQNITLTSGPWLLHADGTVETVERDPRLGLVRCASVQDGDCTHELCPQVRDGEPMASGRSCPLFDWSDPES